MKKLLITVLEASSMGSGFSYINSINPDGTVILKEVYGDIKMQNLFAFIYNIGDYRYQCYAKDDFTIWDYVNYNPEIGYFVHENVLTNTKGTSNNYPYNIFCKNYSSKTSLKLFRDSIEIFKPNTIGLNYSVGIEYESSAGYVPEYYCLKYGLIPLRDGSISGTEYATIPINPTCINDAIDAHTKLMAKYCDYDSDCSTHIHFGGLKVNTKTAYCVYALLQHIQQELFTNYLSEDILHSGKYKKSHKDYCKALPFKNSFEDMYKYLSMGTQYYGSLCEGHPASPDGRAKWNITSRYHWCNLVNFCFYDKCKTVEFRFMPPTHNKEFIKNFVVILEKILQYAEDMAESFNVKKFTDVTYDKISNKLPKNVLEILSKTCTKEQYSKLVLFLKNVRNMYDEEVVHTIEDDGNYESFRISKVLVDPTITDSIDFEGESYKC